MAMVEAVKAGSGKPAFDWSDPLLLEDELTEEERLVRDTARDYAQSQLQPRVLTAFREDRFDREIMTEMGALGLLGATIPEEYGGAGAGYVAYGLIAREVERVDSGYRSALSVQSSLVMFPIHAYGTEEQRQEIPAAARDRRDRRLLRPDRARPRLRPRRHADPRGQGSPAATGSPARRPGSPTRRSPTSSSSGRSRRRMPARSAASCSSAAWPGLSAPKIEGKVSLRASVTGEIVMDNVEVPEANLLPNASGLAGPFGCLNRARYGIAWGTMGAAEDCWHRARQYVLDRKQFGRPLAANQLVQKKLADMQTEIALGLQAALRVGRLFDAGRVAPEMISLVKRNNAGKALDIARRRPRHAWRQRHRRRVPRHPPHAQPRDGQHLRGDARHPRPDPRPRPDRHPGVFVD